MKCFSLFSGIGCFDLALREMGHEIVGACEIDKHARQVYARHFPEVRIYPDAREIRPEELPDFDLLCAGFPCQSFSVAGKRKGFEESRGTLFFEIARIAKAKRPEIILLENVKGLLNHEGNKTFETILQTLGELGYDAEWRVRNSKNYGVPQNRERVFIIGHLRSGSRREILPFRESDEDSAVSDEMKIKCQQVDVSNKGHRSQQDRVYDITGIMGCLAANRTETKTLIAIPVLTPNRVERRQEGRRFKTDGEPAFTLTAQDRHGIYDGQRIRVLTPKECERLQGLPDDYTGGVPDSQRWKQVGNGITVNVAKFILSFLDGQDR